MTEKILHIDDVSIAFQGDPHSVRVVDKLRLQLHAGETLGIVGESGCGKSISSLSVMGLLPNNAYIESGSIWYQERELNRLSPSEIRKIRGKEITMIFQEPMTSLNPVFPIYKQLTELIRRHTDMSKKKAKEHAIEMLELVGIPRASDVAEEYPHQLSGGMRQRVMIAMAIACNPSVLIADEPTTALDVTVQAQILDVLRRLQKERKMSIMLITHDLGVVAEMCDRVLVMYAGQVVEESTVEELFSNPKHPYTEGLLKSVPQLKEEREELYSIPGTVPVPQAMPTGCRFASRCPKVMEKCSEPPPGIRLADDIYTRCWLYEHG